MIMNNMKRINQNWGEVTFADIMSPAKVVLCGDRQDLPVLSITMHDGIVEQKDRFKKVVASHDTSKYKVVKNGQLVIAFPIDEGLIYTQDVAYEGIMSPAYNVWDVNYENFDRRFLGLYFHSPFAMAYYKNNLRGTTQRRRALPKDVLLSMPIPKPSLAKQKEIVSELDSINESITILRQQIKDLDALSQSLFYSMFGDPIDNPKHWDMVKLGNIAEPTIGLTYKPENVVDNNEGIIVLRSSNIQDSELSFEDIVRVNISIKEEKFVRDGDILMCSRNGSIKLVGKVAMIKGLSEKMSYGAFMTIIRSIYNPYLFAYFKTPAFRENMSMGKTSTVNQVTVNMLKNINLPLPPTDLQDNFAKKIAEIEEGKIYLSSQIKEMQTLLAARMQYWFD